MFESQALECLQRIEAAVSGDKYENLGIWTVGGGNGSYTMKSPVQTEAEFALFGVSATGSCNILISQNPAGNKLDVTGATSYGASSGGAEGNALEGLFIAIGAAGNAAPTAFDYWQPLGRGNSLYVLISGLSSQSCFVMVAWRRLLNREIPAPPRQKPTTHTTRQSHRAQRVLAAESPMTAAAQEGRYPIPGAGFYKHIQNPTADFDQGAIERGIAKPLSAAEIALAKLRGKSGVY